MPKDEICSLLLPTRASGLPRCCRGPWYPCCGPLCGFNPCALQSSSSRFIKVSLDASGPTLAHVPGKYPYLKMPPVTSTNLTFNMPVFRKGLKDSSVYRLKQYELLDHESKAVQPPAVRTIQNNYPRCAQAVASHRWSDSVAQTHGEVSQPDGTRIQIWPCRTAETDPSKPRLAVYHPGSPCPFHPVPCAYT
ncbi:hypothetical protein HPB52_008900 [Rhipicephalus sanguineus]|uniref:Uncharacterized protein n=1 Tax=Rhipicephalus sanguineus TaxID=34632 RepID=A0A9D4T901_RHISA|nr:hypothetical protein HPB52_008900 [Rhipicephalus sanguineus]